MSRVNVRFSARKRRSTSAGGLSLKAHMALTKYRTPREILEIERVNDYYGAGLECSMCGKPATRAYKRADGGYTFKHSRLVSEPGRPGKFTRTHYCETKGAA